MECARCRAENHSGDRFCVACGAELRASPVTYCAGCGAAVMPGQRFCGRCGAALAPAAGELAEGGPAVAWSGPEGTAARHHPGADPRPVAYGGIEGERKQVTVLFADIRGSTALIEGLDPELALQRLDPALTRMKEAVHRFGGTVNAVQGDGIMALFGAPLAHEDHAVRACHAALAIQAAIRGLADPHLAVRVGLHSGEVVVRSVRNDLSVDYHALGPTVHIASRMEQLAAPGTVRLTAATHRLAAVSVEVRSLGLTDVKGLSEPIETFELTGTTGARALWSSAPGERVTRLVGRRTELDVLRRALRQVGAGHGQAVALVGEPGVGKSRLVWELARSEWTAGWRTLRAGAVSFGTGTPYLPFVDLLKFYFEIEPRGGGPDPVGGKVERTLHALGMPTEEPLPALLALLGLEVEDPSWHALAPTQRRQRIVEAVRALLLHESGVRPLLVVIEDLQWVDSETDALLHSLVESLPGSRVLLLVTYRPGYRHGWPHARYTQLPIGPLSAASAEELLGDIIGTDAGLAPLNRFLIERTGGNALFLEESVRSLVESHALQGERGAYRLATDVRDVRVPETVQAILAMRIDRLPAEEKQLLQSAAVIGRDVPFPILSALLADTPEATLRRRLANLLRAEFFLDPDGSPEPTYSFKHPLTHEVAYSSLLRDHRRALHAGVVRAVERLYGGDRLGEHAEVLGHHAARGEEWGKAVTYLRQAGAKAMARSASPAATAYFEEALAALGHVAGGRGMLEQAVDLRFELRNSLLSLGKLERILDYLSEAEALAARLGDPARLGRAYSHMAHCCWLLGDWERAIESGERALETASVLGDFAVQVATQFFAGLAHYSLGNYEVAIEFLRRNVAAVQGDAIGQRFGLFALPAVVSRGWLVWCLAERGEFAEGAAIARDAVRIAEAVGQPFDRVQAWLGVGGLHLYRGDVGEAVPVLEQALELCRSANIPILAPRVASSLGYAYALSGRVDEALPLLERATEEAASMRLAAMHSIGLRWLSEAYLVAGRPRDAHEQASRALKQHRLGKERGLEAWILLVLARIHALRDPPDRVEAARLYRRSLRLAEERGMRPLAAHCRLGLGMLYRAAGHRPRSATRQLAAATSLFRALGMTPWLDRPEEAASLRQGERRGEGRPVAVASATPDGGA